MKCITLSLSLFRSFSSWSPRISEHVCRDFTITGYGKTINPIFIRFSVTVLWCTILHHHWPWILYHFIVLIYNKIYLVLDPPIGGLLYLLSTMFSSSLNPNLFNPLTSHFTNNLKMLSSPIKQILIRKLYTRINFTHSTPTL